VPAKRLNVGLVLIAAISCLATLGPSASADDGAGQQPSPVQREGRKIRAEAVHLESTTGLHYRHGAGNTGPARFTPPPCWYTPATSAEHAEFLNWYRFILRHTGDDRDAAIMAGFKRMIDEHAAHASDTDGSWYQLTCDNWGAPAAQPWLTRPLWTWVDPAEGFPAPPAAVEPRDLAEYARSSMVLPELKPELSPKPPLRSVVNMPTWAWMPQAEPENLVASVPGMTVTVIATPTSMRLSTAAPAEYIPGSGACPAHAGSFGSPYRRGAAPECAVVFRKASVTTPDGYELTSTVTWTITWTVDDAPGSPALDPADIETTSNIPVQEIQTIVESGG
jgi:hypothetical protein